MLFLHLTVFLFLAAPLGRSGTGGLERGAMRRSVSASRGGGGHVMSSSMHGGQTSGGSNTGANTAAKLVKKSRPVQTSLTKDPCHDTPDTDNPGLVNFQVTFTLGSPPSERLICRTMLASMFLFLDQIFPIQCPHRIVCCQILALSISPPYSCTTIDSFRVQLVISFPYNFIDLKYFGTIKLLS